MGYTYQCWQCGRRVGQDEVRRMTVATGGGRYSIYRRRVNLCPECAAGRRKRNTVLNVALLGLAAAAVIFGVVRGHSHGSPGLASQPTAAGSLPAATSPSTTAGYAVPPACEPSPCVDNDGLVTYVQAVSRDFAPAAGGGHLVAVTMMFKQATAGGLVVGPMNWELRDASGKWQGMLPQYNGTSPPAGCATPEDSSAPLAPGQTYGPFRFCFDASGPLTGGDQLLLADGCTPEFPEPLPAVPATGAIFGEFQGGFTCRTAVIGLPGS